MRNFNEAQHAGMSNIAVGSCNQVVRYRQGQHAALNRISAAPRVLRLRPSRYLRIQATARPQDPSADSLQGFSRQQALEEPITWNWRFRLAGQMARFALPALSIPLAEPLMSLVDSVAVAQGINGSRDLAALGPNSLIFSFFTYVFSALSIATVSVMTDLIQQDERQTASRVLSASLLTALLGGALILTSMKVYGRQMLAATGCSAVLLGPAWEYMRVRALAMPAALMLMVAQSGLLAQRDSIRPFLAVVAQVSANIAGDYWLVVIMGTGIAGAAWATVASQALGCLLAVAALQLNAEVRLHTGLPKRSDMQRLASTFGPASFIYLCKNLCYIMLQGAAAVLPPLQLAAHQGAWALWSLTSFAQSPVEQAALAFLPAQPQGSQRRNAVGVILMCGAVLGFVTSCMCSGVLLFLPRLLTPDPQLWPFMAQIVPQAFVAILLCGLDVASTGTLIASKRLPLLGRAMAATLAVVVAYFYWVWPATGRSLSGVWIGLVLFFAVRMLQSTAGMLQMYPLQPRKSLAVT